MAAPEQPLGAVMQAHWGKDDIVRYEGDIIVLQTPDGHLVHAYERGGELRYISWTRRNQSGLNAFPRELTRGPKGNIVRHIEGGY